MLIEMQQVHDIKPIFSLIFFCFCLADLSLSPHSSEFLFNALKNAPVQQKAMVNSVVFDDHAFNNDFLSLLGFVCVVCCYFNWKCAKKSTVVNAHFTEKFNFPSHTFEVCLLSFFFSIFFNFIEFGLFC